MQSQTEIILADYFVRPDHNQILKSPILVVGGSTAAFTAAMGALQAGARVCLVQPQGIWGGQLTTQALPAFDDGGLLAPKDTIKPADRDPQQLANADTFAISRTQRQFRDRLRQLQPVDGQVVHNPGGGWVTHVAVTPITAARALNEIMAPFLENGQLTLIPFAQPVDLLLEPGSGGFDRVVGVGFEDSHTQHRFKILSKIVVEATDLGDLLELGDIESRIGQESQLQTGEMLLPMEARPDCQQAFTFCAVVELTAADQGHLILAPKGYDQALWLQSRDFTSTFWHPENGEWRRRDFLDRTLGIFRYRRLQRAQGDDRVRIGDITVINWGTSPLGANGDPPQTADGTPMGCGNDYAFERLVGVSHAQRQEQIQRARDRTQAYLHFLQKEVQKQGYDLKPRGDLTWTDDGIALEPYIREARRGAALTLITHEDVASRYFPGACRARSFADSVGIGQYHYLDTHPNNALGNIDLKYGPPADYTALPFTIPLGALIPTNTYGLILSAKSIGTTHLTNAAYRMHSTEWAIGEAGGHLAALALQQSKEMHEIHASRTIDLQIQLTRAGIPIYWFNDISHDDPDFEAIQVLAAVGILQSEHPQTLHFNPEGTVTQDVATTAVLSLNQLLWHPSVFPLDPTPALITHTQFSRLLRTVFSCEVETVFDQTQPAPNYDYLQRRELARILYQLLLLMRINHQD